MERDYTLFIPEYIAAAAAILVIALELAFPKMRKDIVAYVTVLGAAAYGGSALFWIGTDPLSYENIFVVDDFTMFFRVLAAAVVIVVSLLSASHVGKRVPEAAEYYGLLLTSAAAAGLMAGARELITAYIALELFSFSSYILVGFFKNDRRSNEGSLKYILLGGFSSALLLYGFSIIYGLTGSTFYTEIAAGLSERAPETDIAAVIAYVLIIAGVGFKVSAVPFHAWAPDAYEGAPLPVTALLSTLSKAAGFALILRLFSNALLVDAEMWRWAIVVVAAATMVFGNLVALQQTNLKRLVAYSSIGQVGYMLMAVAAMGYGGDGIVRDTSAALMLHIGGYVLTTLLLFTALIAYYERTGDETIDGLSGLAATQPMLAVAVTVALFSFAGLPFFVGFSTKFFLFQAATTDGLIWLIGLGVLTSFISLYYYLMVIRRIFLFDAAEGRTAFKLSPLMGGLTGLLILGVVVLGIWPTPLFEGADEAAKELELTSISAPADELIADAE